MKAWGIELSGSRGVPEAEGNIKCLLLPSFSYSVTASSDLKNYGGCRNRSRVGRCPPNQNLDSHPRDEGRPVSSLVASQDFAGPGFREWKPRRPRRGDALLKMPLCTPESCATRPPAARIISLIQMRMSYVSRIFTKHWRKTFIFYFLYSCACFSCPKTGDGDAFNKKISLSVRQLYL